MLRAARWELLAGWCQNETQATADDSKRSRCEGGAMLCRYNGLHTHMSSKRKVQF